MIYIYIYIYIIIYIGMLEKTAINSRVIQIFGLNGKARKMRKL